MRKAITKSEDEFDWTHKKSRHSLCIFKNITGLGRRIKRAMNKRSRAQAKRDLMN